MMHLPDLSYDFAREYHYYDTLRQHFGTHHCLFVPCLGGRLSGYVTFNDDAQRLQTAVHHLRLPAQVAQVVTGGAVLWVTDVTRKHLSDSQRISGCTVTFVHNDPPSGKHAQTTPAGRHGAR
jgi:hypothetical protein